MSTFEVGQAVRLRAEFEASAAPATYAADPTYTPTNPTTVVLTIEDPTGVETTPSVTAVGSGYYHASFTPTIPGLWRYEWAGTGTVVATKDGTITVERPLT